MNKYISFDSWFGGLQNIRQSYELAAGISFITKRTLILPEKIFCDFLSEHTNKSTFFDFWDLFDKESFINEFNCIDYSEVNEYQKYNSSDQYFDGICNDVKCFPLSANHTNWGVAEDVLNNIFTYDGLDVVDKFIHFPRNLFGHWYSILGFTDSQKEVFKQKLKKGLLLRKEYDIKPISDPYNAIHLRGGDFFLFREEETRELFKDIIKIIENKIPKDKPLFIATDIQDKDIFKDLKGYTYYFIDDLVQTNQISAIAYDIYMCSNAEHFYGSKFSTFTDYINIVRKYKDKKDTSKTGLNYDYSHIKNERKNYNWHTLFVENY